MTTLERERGEREGAMEREGERRTERGGGQERRTKLDKESDKYRATGASE